MWAERSHTNVVLDNFNPNGMEVSWGGSDFACILDHPKSLRWIIEEVNKYDLRIDYYDKMINLPMFTLKSNVFFTKEWSKLKV